MWVARNKDGSLMLIPDFGTIVRNEKLGTWEFYTFSSYLLLIGMYEPVKIDPNLFPNLRWEDEPMEVEITIKK